MKLNSKFKTQLIAFAYVLLAVVLVSCDGKMPTNKTLFVVEKTELNQKRTATYLLKPLEHGDLNVSSVRLEFQPNGRSWQAYLRLEFRQKAIRNRN